MKPITIRVFGHTQQPPQEICAQLLDTDRWPDFTGYSILPGIREARFETRTPDMIGTRIRVQNTDGSSHIEEIITWDPSRKVELRFSEFTPPLASLASHFFETWTFNTSGGRTEVSRSMAFYPRNLLGWLILVPISMLMKKALEQNANKLS